MIHFFCFLFTHEWTKIVLRESLLETFFLQVCYNAFRIFGSFGSRSSSGIHRHFITNAIVTVNSWDRFYSVLYPIADSN